MLPGYIAGHYSYDDAHIDLGPLSLAASARLITRAAVHLDLVNARVELDGHPPLRFDVLSLNCGAAPGFELSDVPTSAVPVKPIGAFLPRWDDLLKNLRARPPNALPPRIVIVGGGAGGVELALSVHHALVTLAPSVHISLVTAGDALLDGHNARVRRRLTQLLHARRIEVLTGFRVTRADSHGASDDQGRFVAADLMLWVTAVAAPQWLADSGLTLDEMGFVAVDRTLRSVSDDRVFAAGDVAAMINQPRPKSGVFAVRQGPVLADNLRRRLLGRPLRNYRAQRRVLALISEGTRSATASRGAWSAHGALMWQWKDWIDRRFMERFQRLEPMQEPSRPATPFASELPDAMRCGGCGAKLGADLLARIFDRLAVPVHPRVPVGIGEDAALFNVTGRQVVLTADSLRNMLDDPYEFGRIAARHALNDVFAMGAQPATALALVSVPLMGSAQMEEELYLVMRGALDVFIEEGVALAGGHSSEGLELTVGFVVVGDAPPVPLRKGGLAPGDALILTRPLGSGVLFAGKARGLARTRWLREAIAVMDTSNATAARILREHGARSCTDVTGFGLLGHLAEMLRASGCGAVLRADAVPVYAGVMELLARGVVSSLQPNNERVLQDFSLEGLDTAQPRVRVLMDPQTAGGLLAGVPAQKAAACIDALRRCGYPDAQVVGEIHAAGAAAVVRA